MKKLCFILAMILTLSLCACGDAEPELEGIDMALYKAVMEYNEGKYQQGDCRGAGVVLLDQKDNTYYTITMYGEYKLQDDAMCKIAGSGAIPAVITLDEDYKLVEYKEPVDGDGYFDMVREMFPVELHERVLSLSMEDYMELTREEADCITAYLEAEGLDVVIKQ